MQVKEQIKILLIERKMKLRELAEKLTELTRRKYTENSLSQRLGRGSITYNEVLAISNILDYKIQFIDISNKF